MTQLYTPFMAQAGKTIGDAYTKQQQNKLYSSAYMGKPGAMEQLMQVNPAMANQLQLQKQQAEQLKLQQSAAIEKRKLQESAATEKRNQALIKQNTPLLKEEAEAISKFDNVEDANAYRQRRLGELQQTNPELAKLIGDQPLTQEHLDQLKTVHRDKSKSEEMTEYQKQSLDLRKKSNNFKTNLKVPK